MAKEELADTEPVEEGPENETSMKLELAQIEGAKALASLKERFYLYWGLHVGLTLGMLANFVSSHWIHVLRGIVSEQWWWAINVFAFLITLSIMLTLIAWMLRRIRKIQSHYQFVQRMLEVVKEK